MTAKKKMKIIVAASAGFCWGVNRAFDKVMEVAKGFGKDKDLFTYGPLIHNPQAVETLEKEGVKVINEIPEKIEGGIFIRTHGISPDERNKLKSCGAKIFDATCPDVGIIQGIVKGHIKKGYFIVIVGNQAHPEVGALLGFAEGHGLCISRIEGVEKIPADTEKICIVAQSTQKEEEYAVIADAIKAKYKDCKVFNTICKATVQRQEEVKKLAKLVDAMVVVGGYNSANTNKLAQISKEMSAPTFHIEDASELNPNDFNEFTVIGVTAGASTPTEAIEKVVEKIKEFGEADSVEVFGKKPERHRKNAKDQLSS